MDSPDGGGLASGLMLPFIGFGVFVMLRRQMLGLKERAERLAVEGLAPEQDVPPVEVGEAELVPA